MSCYTALLFEKFSDGKIKKVQKEKFKIRLSDSTWGTGHHCLDSRYPYAGVVLGNSHRNPFWQRNTGQAHDPSICQIDMMK